MSELEQRVEKLERQGPDLWRRVSVVWCYLLGLGLALDLLLIVPLQALLQPDRLIRVGIRIVLTFLWIRYIAKRHDIRWARWLTRVGADEAVPSGQMIVGRATQAVTPDDDSREQQPDESD